MRARLITLPVLLLAFIGVSAVNAAASPRAHHVTATIAVTDLSSQKGAPPAPGSSTVNGGTVSMTGWGKGALHANAIFNGWPSFAVYLLRGTGRFVFAKANLNFTFTMQATLNPDRRVFITGNLKVTGGTHSLKRATGKLSFQGSSDDILAPASLTATGTITY